MVKFIQNFKLGILILGERTFVFHNGSSRATKRIARHASICFCLLKKFEIGINLSFGQKKNSQAGSKDCNWRGVSCYSSGTSL
jgi:hypothetical protein